MNVASRNKVIAAQCPIPERVRLKREVEASFELRMLVFGPLLITRILKVKWTKLITSNEQFFFTTLPPNLATIPLTFQEEERWSTTSIGSDKRNTSSHKYIPAKVTFHLRRSQQSFAFHVQHSLNLNHWLSSNLQHLLCSKLCWNFNLSNNKLWGIYQQMVVQFCQPTLITSTHSS